MPPRRKKAAAGEKFGNPFFCAPEAREKFSDLIFIFVRPDFHFGPIPPLKKFGDDVCDLVVSIELVSFGYRSFTFHLIIKKKTRTRNDKIDTSLLKRLKHKKKKRNKYIKSI